jgi:hypothetical protein
VREELLLVRSSRISVMMLENVILVMKGIHQALVMQHSHMGGSGEARHHELPLTAEMVILASRLPQAVDDLLPVWWPQAIVLCS